MANKTALTTHSHTRIDLPAHTRAAMGMILNERLADDLDLERQAKQAHWNIRGARFQQLHELFDATAALAVGWSDELAERAGQLGGPTSRRPRPLMTPSPPICSRASPAKPTSSSGSWNRTSNQSSRSPHYLPAAFSTESRFALNSVPGFQVGHTVPLATR